MGLLWSPVDLPKSLPDSGGFLLAKISSMDSVGTVGAADASAFSSRLLAPFSEFLLGVGGIHTCLALVGQ